MLAWLILLMTPLFLVARQQPEPVKLDEAAATIPDLAGYPWFYLRDGRSLTDIEIETAVTLMAVGDVMLGRGVAEVAKPLAAAAPWLQAADLTFGNLESVIVAGGEPRTAPVGEPQPIILNAPRTAVTHLTAAGFDLLSLANNHSLDYGREGLAETAVRLQQAGMTPLGAGTDVEAAYQPVFREVKGVRLAFLAFNAVSSPGDDALTGDDGVSSWVRADWQLERILPAVMAARQQANVVVVSVHWGYGYELQVDPWQETAVQTLFAAGADVIIGHHPHVAQPMVVDRQNSKLAAYSLGNFVFDQTQEGLALRIFVDSEGLRAAQALPIWTGLRPRLMTPTEAESLLARVQPTVPRLAFACTMDTCASMGETEATEDTGWFWSGAIDLTGDGVPEQVRRTGEQVIVYEGTTAVWQSPPAWRVVDVALGDPNDDGRFELLLAIWQTDSEGYERSQPYIVGHRRGEYQLLWGGRPVNTPILAVELGDVDGDGAEELVVLEQQAEAQSVSVWRWQGWSFSLMWRSENGRFSDLVLQPVTDNRLLITVSP